MLTPHTSQLELNLALNFSPAMVRIIEFWIIEFRLYMPQLGSSCPSAAQCSRGRSQDAGILTPVPLVQAYICTEPIEKLYTPPRAAGFAQEPKSEAENGANLLVFSQRVDYIDEQHFSSPDTCSSLNDCILPARKYRSLCLLP
jgi:hypothetical protein